MLPNHHPVVLAKRAATVDVLSGGRLRLCVGVGWLREEIEACDAHGVPAAAELLGGCPEGTAVHVADHLPPLMGWPAGRRTLRPTTVCARRPATCHATAAGAAALDLSRGAGT